jgi:hypothetical protein
MKKYLKYISFCALGFALLSALLLFIGKIDLKTHFILITIGMAVWFATAPFWKKNKSLEEAE